MRKAIGAIVSADDICTALMTKHQKTENIDVRHTAAVVGNLDGVRRAWNMGLTAPAGRLDRLPSLDGLSQVVFEATSTHAYEANADRYRDAVLTPS